MTATPIADMVDVMVQDGVSAKAIALAVRALETSRDAIRDASRPVTIPERSKAAIRAERYRNKLKQNQALAKANDVAKTDSQSVTAERDASRDGVTERCDLSSLLSKPLKEETEKEETRAVVVDGRKSARGIRLPPDWQPDEELRQFARDHNIDPDELRAEFVDYWIGVPGQRGCKTADRGWPATWRNRVRDRQSYRKAKGNGKSVIAAQDRLNDKLREFSEPDLLGGVRGEAGTSNVRLLPSR